MEYDGIRKKLKVGFKNDKGLMCDYVFDEVLPRARILRSFGTIIVHYFLLGTYNLFQQRKVSVNPSGLE